MEQIKRMLRVALAASLLSLMPPAFAARYLMPPADAPHLGEAYVLNAHYEDTLAKLAQRYGVGYRELIDANPNVDPWLPGEGTPILLPTEFLLPPGERRGLVLNLSEFRLYYYLPS